MYAIFTHPIVVVPPVSISISQAACTVIKHMCRKDEPHNDRLVRLWLQGTVPDAISRMGASKCGHTCFLVR